MSTTIPEPAALRKARAVYDDPIPVETEAFELPVTGAIPAALAGRFVRNGPNARAGRNPHPFTEDGMLHGLRVQDGAARWYRNRWVRTRSFETGAPYVRADGTFDYTAGPANTNVIVHAGRVLALVESSFPYEVTPELATVGPYDFAGRLATPFSAHPKRDPRTGELHGFGMSYAGGLTYHRIDARGALVASRAIAVPAVTMMHDFAITERHVVFMDLPVVFDRSRAQKGAMPFAWSDTYGARLGVLRRDDPSAPVRWLDVAPCYVFHVLNAYDDGANVIVDVVRYAELWRDGAGGFPPAFLHRWTIDTAAGVVRDTPLDDCAVEFPRVNESLLGGAHRFGYAVARGAGGDADGVRKYDLATGTAFTRDFGAGAFAGEPVFVPAPGETAEDAGWLMAFVYDAARDASDFVVLDATDLSTVASVALPQRVPAGFHGNWIDDAELA